MKRKYLLLTLTLLFSIISLGSAQDDLPPEFGIKEVLKIDIQINADGFANVKEDLVLDQTTGRILIPKYSGDLYLVDSQGDSLGYELNQYGEEQTLNIYLKSPQEKSVTLSYKTPFLITKNASGRVFKFSTLSTPRVTIITVDFLLAVNITSLKSKETVFIYPPHLTSPLFLYPQSNKTSLEINYELPPSTSLQTNFIHLIILFLFIATFLISFFYVKKRKSAKLKKPIEIKKEEEETIKVNPSVMKMLDKQEKEVIKLLEASLEEEITQAYIYKTTGIPKSSLSDIIRRLEQRDLIEKKREGRINWIKLKKWVFE